ncbi:hypothetical protein DICVIV_04612 [Dictyocaulus viviparus]|uniref:Transporter, major facilitator family protein n=1 Tax=Dictyocaulus viviparus TaxID=29172 RepID=A0A0D8Y400_DICVI|nr:hypothetical protein DICVIV_04612 [Dictyocaulus viviparus]
MNGFRYIILLVSTLFMTFIYSNRIVFGFSIICEITENITNSEYFLSDSSIRAWMFTVTAIGMCLGPIPLYWAHTVDTRVLILAYGLLSTVATALYPFADGCGLWPSLLARFLSVIYYTLGFLTLLFTLMFTFIYLDNVYKNRVVSQKEIQKIIEGRKIVSEKVSVPYIDLLGDVSIWINFILFIGYYIGMIVYQQYSPMFIKQILKYSVRETGYFSAIPMVFAIILKITVGRLIDHGLGLDAKWRLATPLVFLEFVSSLSIFLTGFIGAQHAHFALNFNMFIAGFVQILIPGGVQLLVSDNTREQWSILFYTITAITLATTILYVTFVEVKAATWTEPKANQLPLH